MKLGDRNIGRILKAIFEFRHYKAFLRSFLVYSNPLKYLKDYLLSTGNYPAKIHLTNKGTKIYPTLYSSHDLLTVNEIFCREDYSVQPSSNVIVDIGANIGLSALYFLTKSPASYLYLYEPDPRNVEKLKTNLQDFNFRYQLETKAVSDENGILSFGIEDSGRYGGLNLDTGNNIKVECVHINSVIESILEKHPHIDILKFDTEGVEIKTINAIAEKFFSKIETIYFEEINEKNIRRLNPLLLKHFQLSQRGPIYRLKKNNR